MNKVVIIVDRCLYVMSGPGLDADMLQRVDYRRSQKPVTLTNQAGQTVTLQWSEGQMSWFCGTIRIKTNTYDLERLVNGLL